MYLDERAWDEATFLKFFFLFFEYRGRLVSLRKWAVIEQRIAKENV